MRYPYLRLIDSIGRWCEDGKKNIDEALDRKKYIANDDGTHVCKKAAESSKQIVKQK